jgi:hypothetical protein
MRPQLLTYIKHKRLRDRALSEWGCAVSDEDRAELATRRVRWAALALKSAADELVMVERRDVNEKATLVIAETERVVELFERLEGCLV